MADLQEYPETWQQKMDELWASLRVTQKQIEDRAKAHAELDRIIKETDLIVKETARQMKETDRQMKETDRQMKETDRQMKETDRKMKETDRKMGDLGNRFGELAEHLVAPNIMEKFNALGYDFDDISTGRRVKCPNGDSMEVDILLENETYSIAVEVKAKAKDQDIDHHIKRLEFLRRYKDKHRDSRKLLGAIAGAIMPESVRNYALKAGLYVIEQTGDTVKIDSPPEFIPREW
jgi:hypothetical protein